MKIHEHQAKEIFRRYRIPVPIGEVAFDVASAVEAAGRIIEKTGDETVVVKAQIHAGGRGKGGGVILVDDPAGAQEAASKLIGKPLVTYQTGPEGKMVNQVLVEGILNIATELYLGMVVDRATEQIVNLLSSLSETHGPFHGGSCGVGVGGVYGVYGSCTVTHPQPPQPWHVW